MADGGFDPCECIWNHQAAMRRLIAFLRNSQSYCTDTQCYDELPGPEGNMDENLFLMVFLAVAAFFFLIVFRPQAEYIEPGPSKNQQTEPDDSAPPPLC